MSQEKLKVLEMLEKGNITSEEALRLIELLQEGDVKEAKRAAKHTEEAKACEKVEGEVVDDKEEDSKDENTKEEESGHQFDYSWIHDLKNNIVESAVNISRYVGSQTYNTFGFGPPNQFYSTTIHNVEQLKALRLTGKNDRVEIVGHKENSIIVEARYKLKRDQELRIEFEEEDGIYKLNYDYNAVHSMGLYIQIPDRQIPELRVDNKNSEIVVKNVKAEKADFITKNGGIELDSIKSTDLSAETKNAPISIYDITASKINLTTFTSPISLKSVDADFAKLLTTNASVNLDGIDIREIYAKTSNAGMIFRNFYGAAQQKHPLYNLEAYTSTGDLIVELPQVGQIPCRINAATSLGNIRANVGDLEYLAHNKDFVKAKSKNYDTAEHKMNITLQTSNSNIDIRSLD